MLKTGMIIAERYEIAAKIGTGGMADVYKAMDHKLNRYVAVKVLKAEFREDTTFIKKFRSEAQAAAGLTHPNIVNVYDVGDDEGVYYIVMELIEGITLKEYISKKGKLSVKEATSIAIQVSMGLEAAHNHGIVHRDVKPQNIIISTDGKVKVTDFGIARAASSNTISSNVMGSVHYSSPEQVRGGYSDEKSDIYSLGITLYEMVTGRVPYDGDTTVAIAIKHLQEEMVPPSIYAEDLPNSLEQIIFKCTQKSVGRRYNNMEEVIADLKHSLIDPQGDFVKLNTVDNVSKTRVISDEELGEIKNSPKQSKAKQKTDIDQLREELENDGYEDEEEEPVSRPKKEHRTRGRISRRKRIGRVISIIASIIAIVAVVFLIYTVIKKTGLFEKQAQKTTEATTPAAEDNNLVEVPDLVGKTEDEAKALAAEVNLGTQMMGEEASTQTKGYISSQETPAGTQVEAYSTIKYYISKGSTTVTVPDVDGSTGIEAQEMLENLGLNVTVQKEYSDTDDYGYVIYEPGYACYTTPASGSSVNTGENVTLVVSRGLNYGSGTAVEVPSVVGMSKNDAITILGKWLTINVEEQANASVPQGEVIAQNPEAYTASDPDGAITIYVSTGEQQTEETTVAAAAADTGTDTAAAADTTVTSAASGTWKCTQRLNTPDGYNGGPIRLELIQQVNGSPQASVVLDGAAVEFPYQLDITGVEGVSEGTLYLSELVDGAYKELGSYSVKFEAVQ